jgi:hypothetical protein
MRASRQAGGRTALILLIGAFLQRQTKKKKKNPHSIRSVKNIPLFTPPPKKKTVRSIVLVFLAIRRQNLIGGYQSFGGIHYLYLQGKKKSVTSAPSQQTSVSCNS